MNIVSVAAIASSVSFLASVIVSSFIGGSRWGRMEANVKAIERDVAEIKGMFTLRIKD